MNLISNGIKYNREKGSLTVRLECRGESVVVMICDTGIGMSKKELEGLFAEFYRIKNPQTCSIPGTGLGLATVKRVLDEDNGSITVSSKPGKGTAFTVTLPAAAAAG